MISAIVAGLSSAVSMEIVPVERYENVVMVAGGFGIAAYLSYMMYLIRGSRTREDRLR